MAQCLLALDASQDRIAVSYPEHAPLWWITGAVSPARRRLGLARRLELRFLDEPATGLDPETRDGERCR